MALDRKNPRDLEYELEATRRELDEARAVLAALGAGEADAVVVQTAAGPKVYTLKSADQPYRTLVETLKEGAITTTSDGVVLYCNESFARFIGHDSSALTGTPLAGIIGSDLLAALTADGGATGFECTLVRSDGKRRDCLVSSVPHQADGVTIWCHLLTDVTGQALRLRHSAIVESTDDAIMSFDRDGRITSWNRAAETLFGYTAGEAIGRDADLLVAPLASISENETRKGNFDAALSGVAVRRDTRRVAKDGTVIDVSTTSTPIRTHDGVIIGVSAIMRDITARKRTEAALGKSESHLSRVLRQSPAGIVETDAEWRMVLVNARWCEMLGYSETEMLGMSIIDVTHPESREATLEAKGRLARGGPDYQIEKNYRRKDGTLVRVQSNVAALRDAEGNFEGVLGVILDLTARLEAEERLTMALDAGQAGMWEYVPGTGGYMACDAARRLVGLPPGTHTHEMAFAVIHPDDRSNVEKALRHTIESGALFAIDMRCSRPDGTMAWLHSQAELKLDGAFPRVVGLVQDITARKLAEERLRDSEERLSLSLRAASAGSWDWRISTDEITWSPENYELYDIEPSPAGLYLADWQARIHPDDRERTGQEVSDLMAGRTAEWNAEFRIVRRDGTVRWLLGLGKLERTEDGSPLRMSGINIDITKQKQHEEHVQLLMGEINHRSKNMLAIVQAIAARTATTHPADFVASFGKRIQALAAGQDLLVKSQWKAVLLGDLVRAQLAQFADAQDDRVAIDGPPVEITASAAQGLGMALHELATNAIKHGALSTASGRVSINWSVQQAGDGPPGFAMTWAESGGPPVEEPSRSGFGSTVIGQMIGMELGCEAEIDFAPTGLVWRINCKADKVMDGSGIQQFADAPEAKPDRARILVVEDEAINAIAIAGELDHAGFDVLGPAASVAQALALLDGSGCDAAILDVNLGRETSEPIAQQLRAMDIPFVVVSGYSRDQLPAGYGSAPLFGKPMDFSVLMDGIWHLLSETEQVRH